jgi:serine/threonine-protein kinase RsbT
MATALGFDGPSAESIVLAVSELAMNLLRYAGSGEIQLCATTGDDGRRGLMVECSDRGPGIGDPVRALEDGYTTGGGLGSGLPGVRRLMDEFDLQTGPTGTRIRACKWLSSRSSSR